MQRLNRYEEAEYSSGRAYEKWICHVFQIWFENAVTIETNKWLEGASGVDHELDLYLHFSLRDRIFHVAAECKNHVHIIGKRDIAVFESVLRDLNMGRKEEEMLFGIFISRNGFQSGAVDYARYSGILLLEIREPDMYEWARHCWRRREKAGFPEMEKVTYPEFLLNTEQRSRIAEDLAELTKENMFPYWKGDRNIWEAEQEKETVLDINDIPDLIVMDSVHHIGFLMRTKENEIRISAWYG